MFPKMFLKIFAILFFAISTHSTASQFYVFPVKELEGVSDKVSPEKRPLIDKKVRELFTAEMQTAILDNFAKKVESAFTGSVVHALQVRDTLARGNYKYIDNDSLVCGEGFTVPIKQSYAVVIGLTRASWYQVNKERGVVELLIPITLNIQLIKPETAKVVYSTSQTLYSPFRFGNLAELEKNKTTLISSTIQTGLNQQINDLVKELQNGFKPKETPVKIAGKSNGVLVADKGFEVGFVSGDMPSAVNTKTQKEVIFQVLSAESGYSVIKLSEGDANVGDEFVFQFQSSANDSSKPRVMPVVSVSNPQTSSIADFFAKDIGFKADFQIAAVDVNFKDTQDSIDRKASCVPWGKYASVRKDLESRVDHPDFFLRFDLAQSPVTFESGLGGVETRESFATTVAVQLVDLKGNVLFSELGQDFYNLEKKGGRGLDINNAFEISMKNASSAAAKRFVANVKFQPGDFEITNPTKTSFTVQGLNIPDGAKISFDVLRPLNIQVNGKKTFWRLSLGDGATEPQSDAQKTSFSYSVLDTEVQRGDRLIIVNLPKKGQTRLSECPSHYVAPGSIAADYLVPIIRSAAFNSQKTQISITSPQFFEDANFLLNEGKFKLKTAPSPRTEVCVRTGYSVKAEPPKCDASGCSLDIVAASTVIQEKGDQRVANVVQAEKISLKGVAEPQVTSFIGYKSFESVIRNLPKLTEKLNTLK